MTKLGVNIDHVATLRQARRGYDPDPVAAARICVNAGAHSIIAHLREDRRHIQDWDVFQIRKTVKKRFNLEMSIHPEIVNLALKVGPDQATLVPERRQELTTEGGLDVCKNSTQIKKVFQTLRKKNIDVSLFIDPIKKQIDRSKDLGVTMIEFHTGTYARAFAKGKFKSELDRLVKMTAYARQLGFVVNAGHGLDYKNVSLIANIPGMQELNIGHSIISRSVFVGLEPAVKMMLSCMAKPR